MEYFGDVSKHHCSYIIVLRTFPDDTDLSLSKKKKSVKLLVNYKMAKPRELVEYQLSC